MRDVVSRSYARAAAVLLASYILPLVDGGVHDRGDVDNTVPRP